jgi:L-fucose dehydrogenase
MNLHLQDKVFIVTGGGSGIGAAISLGLAEEGAIPVIFANQPLPAELAAELDRRQPQTLCSGSEPGARTVRAPRRAGQQRRGQ